MRHDNTNLRSGPGTGFASLGQVHSGNRFQALFVRTVNNELWYEVLMTSGPNAGRSGHIRSDLVRID